jgi:hypothetical protein
MRSFFLIALLPTLLLAIKPVYPGEINHPSVEDIMAARNGEWTDEHSALLKKRSPDDAGQISKIKNNNKAIKTGQKSLGIDWSQVDFDELENELKNQLV